LKISVFREKGGKREFLWEKVFSEKVHGRVNGCNHGFGLSRMERTDL